MLGVRRVTGDVVECKARGSWEQCRRQRNEAVCTSAPQAFDVPSLLTCGW